MRLSVVVVVVVVAVVGPRAAAAYPQFQFALDEERCGACHLAPGGGGLLTDFGRDEAGGTISRGGDGRLLHGAWTPPGWLALGGDARFAVGDKQLAGRNEPLAFPMQLDLQARATAGRLAVAVTAGVRGAARDPRAPVTERLSSREHYATYERDTISVRAGRYFPVFGLRLPDHTAYVRRFLGFGLLEEPYALEVSHRGDQTETYAAGFLGSPTWLAGAGVRASGAAVSHEHRFADAPAMIGGHARLAVSPAEARYTLGGFGRWWMKDAGLLWQAEVDAQHQTFDAGPGRGQIAAYLATSTWLTRGLLLTGALHLWEPDLALRASSRLATEIDLQYFPRAHVEVHLLVRGAGQGNDFDQPGFLSLLQVHYYL